MTSRGADGARRGGFGPLAEALTAAGDDVAQAGVAYVRSAVTHPAHFEVMFRPDTHHRDDRR